jgi:potassium-transporting ATPase KdpC subunit
MPDSSAPQSQPHAPPLAALLRAAVALYLTLTLLTGVVYPLAVTAIARVLFPAQAAGSLVMRDGRAVGSALIGQSFSSLITASARPAPISAR